MKIFILEDNDVRISLLKSKLISADLTICKEADEAIKILEQSVDYDLFLLDHDLGGRIFVSTKDSNTGTRVAEFLQDKNVSERVIIHSMNHWGAKNMMNLLPGSQHIPFHMLKDCIITKEDLK